MPQIEQLSLLPEDERVEWLTRRPEDQWFDRKSARTTAKQLADLMVGLANAEGGLIVLGIWDRRVEGIASGGPRRVNEWRQAAMDLTDPPVRHRFQLIDCTTTGGRADHLGVVEVEASERVHRNARGETYLRVGDENRRLGPLEAQELAYDKGDSVFDGTVVQGAVESDLDPELVERYLRRVRASGRRREALQARGLLALDRRGALRPSVAGILVLGANPQAHFPQATLRLLRYQGSSREAGARSNVIRDRRLEGPLPAQVDAARRALRRWIPEAIRLGEQGRFLPSTIIPEFAWLEAIVNATVHRSYSLGGDHIRAEVFDDRLVVESPGRLPGLVQVETIRSTRFARNPRVARAMSDLGYGRELGEGVNRMFEEMERAGLPDPVYLQGPASVQVTLLADPLARRILSRLPAGSERFAEFLTRRGRVTTTEAVQLFGTSRPTALNYLHDLTEAGLIEHVGSSLKDPRGFWRLRRGEG